MSQDWSDSSFQEEELFYSTYFNMEEEVQKADDKKASKTAAKEARTSSDETTGLQKTNKTLQTQMRPEDEREKSVVFDQQERASPAVSKKAPSSEETTGLEKTNEALQTQMRLNTALPNQLQQEEKGSQAAASQAREETLHKEMENEKMQKEQFDSFAKSEYSLRNNLLHESQQREKILLQEMAHLKEKVATEAQKADDERGMTLVNLKLEMFFQAAAAKTREEALQKQFDDLKTLREAERDNFTKSQERFEEERKRMEEVANEAKLRQRAEDEGGMTLVELKLEMASQASVAKAREDALLKEMEDLKSCQELQMKLRNTKLNNLLQEHGTVKSGLQGEIAALKQVHTNEMDQQSRKMKVLQEEMEETKGALKHSEKEKASLTKETLELKKQIMDKVADIEALKNEVSQRTDSLEKVTVAMVEQIQLLKKQIKEMKEEAVQASTNWEVEKTFLLKNSVIKFREKESENQTLMKKIKQVEHEAVQQKASHKQAMSELQEEKAYMLKETQDLKTALERNGDEIKLLHETISALSKELETKKRSWFKRLFDH